MKPTNYKNLPKIAIIGRPNVGKSSLFNRIIKVRKAIAERMPGVTRDRLYAQTRLGNYDLILIDTGGLISKPVDKIEQLVYKQSREAIDESDAIIFVCDITSGISCQDEHVASLLKRSGKKIFLVINKVDSPAMENDAFVFYKLGLGRPYPVSALHGNCMEALYEDMAVFITAYRKENKLEKDDKIASCKEIKIAIVGRPNVGKSSFINCVLNQERLLVDERPGTTRDSIDVSLKRDNNIITLIDTAGMRHKKKIKEVVEIFSLARTKQSIRRCDIALIMIDITSGLSRDDIAVIDYVIKQGKACALLVNKRDLAKGLDVVDYEKALRNRLKAVEWIPVIFTSCKDKKNIIKAIDTACAILKSTKIIIETPRINKLLESIQQRNPHPLIGKSRPKIFYATQASMAPLRFILFCSNPKNIRTDYIRFIEGQFRREFGFVGAPLEFELRQK